MAKDPAFLFYDGDAARDVSHMNRLERGCYFDLIQAQKKFGGYSMEQTRKIIGKDFDECWPALEMVLSQENGIYFIEWVKKSIEDRKVFAEKNRKRIQEYWDKKKKNDSIVIPRNNHGNTIVLPYVNENENAIENVIVNTILDKGGVGEKETKVEIWPTFEDFWNLYDKKRGDKVKVKSKWDKLSYEEKNRAIHYIPDYKLSQPDKQFRKDPETFLNNKSWNDELIFRETTKVSKVEKLGNMLEQLNELTNQQYEK